MRQISLLYGREGRTVDLPEDNLIGILEGKEAPTVELAQEFDRAWRNPIGIDDPEAVFHPGEKVVFAVTDHTRSTPTREVLPLIWECISSRVRRDDVTIIVATGTHRSPTEEELEAILGDLRREFRVAIHDCDRNHVEVGRSARGTPILIDRIVAEADHVVTLGHIGMHYYAGYSGGRKNILPGVSGRETIEINHAQLTDPHCEGCNYRGNPISEEMSEAARLAKVDFIVDCVFDAHGRVAKIVVGDLEKAHAVGRAFWDSLFQVEIQEPADLVIVSAGGHPKDIDLYQAYKAGNDLFEDWVMRCERPEDVFGILEEEGFKLGGHKAVYLAKDLARAQVALVSEMEDELVRRFFLTPIIDPNEVVALASERFGGDFRTLVMPHGTDTFPLMSD
jgi:nickel-dependent lactate racemase